MRTSSSNGNDSSAVDDGARRRRLKRFLYVGVALVVGGIFRRIISLIQTSSVLSSSTLSTNEKQDVLTSSLSSQEYAKYPVSIGALLVAGSAARLIVLAVRRKEPR